MENKKGGTRQKLVVKGRLPGMNELINANRISRWSGHNQKKTQTARIEKLAAKQLEKVDYKIDLTFKWFCKDRRRDKDNIAGGGQKFVLDGLQEAGIIRNDGWKEIGKISHEYYIDKERERVEVILEESDEE